MTASVEREMAPLVLRLYIAGDSPNSVLARRHLAEAVARLAARAVALDVIDVLHAPERALEDGVFVTPTLIRVSPAPEKRVIGNLRERSALEALFSLPAGAPLVD
jgi:circadian clock protein KaiB